MSKLQTVCDLIDELSRAEKAEALRRIVVISGIEREHGVCGGVARVARTRIPVWVLVRARQLGGSEEEILRGYPTLSRDDLDNAWAYYALHRDDIYQQIESNESEESSDSMRQEHEKRTSVAHR